MVVYTAEISENAAMTTDLDDDTNTDLGRDLSPCIGVCLIEPKSRYCYGCTRTLPEIAQWRKKTDAAKYAMLRDRKRRRAIIEVNKAAS